MSDIAKLALEDGTVYTGTAFGARGEVAGEVCFNTSMVGYQEILTDPSYRGQIVVMTYPQIGIYGVNSEDIESWKIHLAGFVVRERSRRVSNYRAEESLEEFLKKQGIVAMEGIDTRALVRRIRVRGAMKGVLSTVDLDDTSLVHKAQESPGLVGRDLVLEVMPERAFPWEPSATVWANIRPERWQGSSGIRSTPHVVVLDFGMKWNIARMLRTVGCRVTVVPGRTGADDVLALQPDGILLSNGPGDPEPIHYAQETVRRLLPKKPVFGICLGHQLIALACGAKTFKLKFGHRGANQPVLNKAANTVEITTQNHGFSVDPDSIPDELEVTHINLNDFTIEGLRHTKFPAFSVQYHPEASAGPHDSMYLFEQFREML